MQRQLGQKRKFLDRLINLPKSRWRPSHRYRTVARTHTNHQRRARRPKASPRGSAETQMSVSANRGQYPRWRGRPRARRARDVYKGAVRNKLQPVESRPKPRSHALLVTCTHRHCPAAALFTSTVSTRRLHHDEHVQHHQHVAFCTPRRCQHCHCSQQRPSHANRATALDLTNIVVAGSWTLLPSPNSRSGCSPQVTTDKKSDS